MRRPTLHPWSLRALAALLLAFAAAPARPAVAVQVSVEELARSSDAVVRGTVERQASRRAGTHILTDVQLRVDSVWRGAAPSRVTVIVPGGVVGDLGQRVDAAPVFAEGEEVVVFLDRARGAYAVKALAQGKLRIEDGVARPDLSRVTFASSRVPAGERAVEEMSVVELERRVREAP